MYNWQRRQMEEKLKKYNKKDLFLYPAGDNTRQILKEIDFKDINVMGTIDNGAGRVKGYTNYKVDILRKYTNAVVLITSPIYEDEIRASIADIEIFRGEIELFYPTPEFENVKECTEKWLSLYRMDLVLTTKCSLRCKRCANLMQYYEHPFDLDLDIIIRSMEKLLNLVDEIGNVNVLGGEPFLYKKLDEVLEGLIPNKKIKRICVVTNGTICPSENNTKLYKMLGNEKVLTHISDYGELSRNKKLLVECFEKRNIQYVLEENKFFYDTGNLECRNRNEATLNEVFTNCATQCRSLYNGELYYCPRSAHGVDLAYIDKKKNEYVDLLNGDSDTLKRERILDLVNRKEYIEACNYCDIRVGDYYDRLFPAAEQTSVVLK